MSAPKVVFLEGIFVNLRPPDKQRDLELVTVWINRPQVWQYLKTSTPKTREMEIEWFDGLAKHPDDIVLIIETKDGAAIGIIGLHRINWRHGFATTGAFIGEPSYWNRGYGTDAKMMLLEYAFNTLGLRKVLSSVIAFNARSVAYSLKCGYRVIGRRRQQFFRRGRFYDEILLEVFRRQWLLAWQRYRRRVSARRGTKK
ncbi:MAG: GNAT family N-acetyltransferase [Candidatus Kerfeldbacteria bacterium]|nr:GNAT family N-acetyltransferase [Candidatus Kerfeldbacteria bacterium]